MSRKNLSFIVVALLLLAGVLLAFFEFSKPSDESSVSDIVETHAVWAGSALPSTQPASGAVAKKTEGRQQRRLKATTKPQEKSQKALSVAPDEIVVAPMPRAVTTDDLLKSEDPSDQATALDRINALADQQPKALELGLVRWLPALLDQGRYDDVEHLCQVAILIRPGNTPAVGPEQRARVIAALSLGKFDQALGLARANFGIAPLDHTQDAEMLVAEALKHQAVSDGINLSDPATLALVRNAIQTAPVDDSIYSDAIKKVATSTVYNDCIARANLSFLAGRPADALASYEAIIAAIDPTAKLDAKKLQAVADGMARSYRALDASPDRADALVIAIRRSNRPSIQAISATLAMALGSYEKLNQLGLRLALSTELPRPKPVTAQPATKPIAGQPG